MSLTSVDLPEPDTPVTEVKVPSGIFTAMPLRLCSRGLWIVMKWPLPLRRAAGTGIVSAREAEPPPFAARQRAGRPVERQVVEADVQQQAEPLADLLEHAPGDGRLPLGQREGVEERARVLDGLPHDVRDRAAADLDAERLRAQPRALARRAGTLGHEQLDVGPRLVRRGLAISALERLDDSLESAVALAVQDHLAHALAQLGPRRLEGEPVPLRQHLKRLPEVRRLAPRPRRQRAVLERARGIRHEPVGVDLLARADPATLRAGAVRVVEREHPRRDCGERDPALGAGELLGERVGGAGCGGEVLETGFGRGWPAGGARGFVSAVNRLDRDDAVGQA